MILPTVTHYYYNLLTQQCNTIPNGGPCIEIDLFTRDQLPYERIHQIVQDLGCYFALSSVMSCSEASSGNCRVNLAQNRVYTEYQGFLEKDEVNECNILKDIFNQRTMKVTDATLYKTPKFVLPLGDVDAMRQIVGLVRLTYIANRGLDF